VLRQINKVKDLSPEQTNNHTSISLDGKTEKRLLTPEGGNLKLSLVLLLGFLSSEPEKLLRRTSR